MIKYFWRKKRSIIVILSAIVLTVVGARATDNLDFMFSASVRDGLGEDGSPCPRDMVFVLSSDGGFCIDKYESSAGPNCTYKDPQNQAQTRENLNNPNCKPASVANAVPWRYISQTQAQTACAKAGKRLPTNEEWYLAALGTPDPDSGWGVNDCHVASNWQSQPGPTGSGSNCVSAAGAYDMIGNVWEWTQEIIIDGVYEETRELPERGYINVADSKGFPVSTDPNQPDPNYNEDYLWIHFEGVRAFTRGGYWDNQSRAGIYSIYLIYEPASVGPGTGFRCVK